jgi:hypothetical protein
MIHVISFKTSKFDVTKEPENPTNPILGKSLLDWLKNKLDNEISVTEPEAEDWGWYSTLIWENREYLIGSIAYFEEGDDPNSEVEWLFQVDKSRTFVEKLLGREKLTAEDKCFQYFKSVLENEFAFTDVVIE